MLVVTTRGVLLVESRCLQKCPTIGTGAVLDRNERGAVAGFAWYCAKLVIFYMVCIPAVTFLREAPTLVDYVSMAEIISLGLLILVNGEIVKEEKRAEVSVANKAILSIALAVFALFVIQLLGLSVPDEVPISGIVNSLLDNVYWISIIPLVLYTCLDLYIAYILKGDDNRALVAKRFVLLVDIPTNLPLVVVVMLIAFRETLNATDDQFALFVSGSMAVILIASAVSAKALEDFVNNPDVDF